METLRLIRAYADRPAASGQPAPIPPPADTTDETVVLEPVMVTEKREPAIRPAVHETPVTAFVRTGPIWEKVGKKFTKQFFCRPDKGVGFGLSW